MSKRALVSCTISKTLNLQFTRRIAPVSSKMSEGFTIQISSDLINRFAEDGEKKKTRPKPKVPKKSHHPDPKVYHNQSSDSAEVPPPPIAVPAKPLQPYLPVFPPPSQPANPRLEVIQSALREGERVLERLEKQEHDMAKQVTERAKELHEKEFKIPYQKPMPCLSEKDSCLSCYKEHLKDPLKCADAVKNFEDCARRVRKQSADAVKNFEDCARRVRKQTQD